MFGNFSDTDSVDLRTAEGLDKFVEQDFWYDGDEMSWCVNELVARYIDIDGLPVTREQIEDSLDRLVAAGKLFYLGDEGGGHYLNRPAKNWWDNLYQDIWLAFEQNDGMEWTLDALANYVEASDRKACVRKVLEKWVADGTLKATARPGGMRYELGDRRGRKAGNLRKGDENGEENRQIARGKAGQAPEGSGKLVGRTGQEIPPSRGNQRRPRVRGLGD